MCGIAGFLKYPSCSRDICDWSSISRMMAKRGPDDEGLWEDDYFSTVFRRLSVLDLSPSGRQPMIGNDGRYVLVFNGELYNFRELRERLMANRIGFKSTGDTEVVLQSLIHWGREALGRFNGMYALGFYDVMQKTLLIARDHAGIKPLYYARTEKGLMFASQYDQIMANPHFGMQKLSSTGLQLYLKLGYIPAPHAILENSAMLPSGTWLETDSKGNIRTGRHFTFQPCCENSEKKETAILHLKDALAAAVKRQMVSDVPLGCFLSGGIDSPLVTAWAQDGAAEAVKAYTIQLHSDSRDESREASRYAELTGVEHRLKAITAHDAVALVEEATAACGEPFADYSLFPTLLISGEAAKEVTVMLSGDGGDELFWGYGTRFGSVIKIAGDFRLPSWFRTLRWLLKKHVNIGNGYYNLRYPSIGELYREKHSRMPGKQMNRVFPGLDGWPEEFGDFAYSGWRQDETAHWLRQNEFMTHLSMVLLKVDRASMHHSLEVRVPLLDKEVIQAASRFRWQDCLNLNSCTGKLPLRQLLDERIGFHTPGKKGFEAPMDKWITGSLYPLLEEVVFSRNSILGYEIDVPHIRKLVKIHKSGKVNFGPSLWLILSLALWERKHYRNRGCGKRLA